MLGHDQADEVLLAAIADVNASTQWRYVGQYNSLSVTLLFQFFVTVVHLDRSFSPVKARQLCTETPAKRAVT